SIHPSALAAAVLLVLFFWRAEIAVLVEVIFGVLVVLLHVDLELPSRAAPLPAMVAIPETISRLRKGKHQSSARNEFQVEIAEQKAAQMGRVCCVSGIAEGAYKCDESQDANHVLQANRDREGKHEDFLVAEEHRSGHEDGIDSPRGAHSGGKRTEVDD